MLCILCVTTSQNAINIFEEGLSLNINHIISKHFWLQPCEYDANAKFICNQCWNTVESFHKFYTEIEEAHATFLNLKAIDESEFEQDVNSSSQYESYPDSKGFPKNIKIENEQQLELYDNPLTKIPSKNNNDKSDILSDSDSEIPLSTLAKRRRVAIRSYKELSDSESEFESYQTLKVQNKQIRLGQIEKECSTNDNFLEDKGHIRNGKWLPNCYFEESSKLVSPEEYDEFIKQNMKLSCDICHLPMASFFVLQVHFQFVHKKRVYVACCDQKFDLRAPLVDHILLHNFPEYFKCDQCNKVLTSRKGLKMHLEYHRKKIHPNTETGCQW